MHNVNITDVKEPGIVAKLYVPEFDVPRPAVVVLGGSNGGFFEPVAQAFAREGYIAQGCPIKIVCKNPRHCERFLRSNPVF